LRRTLSLHSESADRSAAQAALDADIHGASEAVALMPRHLQGSLIVREVLDAVQALSLVRSNGRLAPTGDPSPAFANGTKSWPALLATMLETPAWCWREAPALDEVPNWLWGDYAAWLFAKPCEFTAAGDAERYSAHMLRHLEVLVRWVERNAASLAVSAAAEAYEKVAVANPLLFVRKDSRRLAELRGTVLSRRVESDYLAEGSPLTPRAGRPLRVGFIGKDFEATSVNRAMLPLFEYLDPREFETLLFSLDETDSAFATRCRSRAKEFHVLPADVARRVERLREATLDVIVFAGEVGVAADALTRIALRRVAPLQVCTQRNGVTSGLPKMDIYVSGALAATAKAGLDFSERIGVLRGPPDVFALEAAGPEPVEPVTREALGLPAAGVLFAALVTDRGVSPETLRAWADALADNPGARILIVLLATGKIAERLGDQFETILAERAVASDRVSLLPVGEGADAEARRLLRIADVYLHPLEGFDAVWVAEALMLGLPVVAAINAGVPDRDAPARLLNQAGLAGFAAPDVATYRTLTTSLAGDVAQRTRIRRQIAAATDAGPDFLDTLAASDAFGALLETAYDELCASDARAFSAEREPLRCYSDDDAKAGVESARVAHLGGDLESALHEVRLALRADPVNAEARVLYGRLLIATARPGRAVDYLLAAVQRLGGDVTVWLSLAEALRADGQMNEAVQALESALRVDQENIEAWFMLMDLAEGAGATELANDALTTLKRLAPGDPRVIALS